jgi:hypothetical protein
MLSKCANPNCSKTFLYLREGKLFRVEVPVNGNQERNSPEGEKNKLAGRYRSEYFWLCRHCASQMTVVWRKDAGVTTVPLVEYRVAS